MKIMVLLTGVGFQVIGQAVQAEGQMEVPREGEQLDAIPPHPIGLDGIVRGEQGQKRAVLERSDPAAQDADELLHRDWEV
jgi:hypothetical protein